MELRDHYKSYRDSVAKDLLPGVVDFAKTLPVEGYANAHAFLAHATQKIQDAASDEDPVGYWDWLEGHQKALIGVLEKFVGHLSGLAAIEKGWRWFRFTKDPVVLVGDKPMRWIPRYDGSENHVDMACANVVFDAEELEIIFGTKRSDFAQKRYMEKKERFFKFNFFVARDIDQLNHDRVHDWTLRLRA